MNLAKTSMLALLVGAAPALAQTDAMSHLGIPVDRVGLVAYTLRDQIAEDPRGTIQAVAECGYKNIEFSFSDLKGDVSSFQGIPVPEIKEMSDEFGFAVPSLGVSAEDLSDRLDKVAAAAKELGATYVRISGKRPAEGTTGTEDDYMAMAELLNTAGSGLAEQGIKVAYHNHEYELVDLGQGRTGMEVLFAETDPENVVFELDLYWTEVADGDAISMFEANPGRFPMVHVKDADETPTFATVGQGTIDFAGIFEHVETAGTEWFFVENDQPKPDGVTSACESYAYITGDAPAE